MALAKKKQILIGIGVGVVILAAAAIAYFIFVQQQSSSVATPNPEKEAAKVADAVASGDYKEIQTTYDQKIEQAKDSNKKAELNFEAASLVIGSVAGDTNSQDAYNIALKYALAADETLKTPQSAAQVGRTYYELKDQTKAEEYFKLAAQRGGE